MDAAIESRVLHSSHRKSNVSCFLLCFWQSWLLSPGRPSDEIHFAGCCPISPTQVLISTSQPLATTKPLPAFFSKQHQHHPPQLGLWDDTPPPSLKFLTALLYCESVVFATAHLHSFKQSRWFCDHYPAPYTTKHTLPKMAATIASNSQDWIASQLSATAVDSRPSRTKWTYVQDRNGMMMIEPVLGFYFSPPSGAKCRWSTENGSRAPQVITRGLPLPDRVLILWNDDRLESEAARIREKYWDEMKSLVAPQRFEDLYEYFDSATLFMSGAVNLWNLINLLANDARHNWRKFEEDFAVECDNWVRSWLERLTGTTSNRESLIKWDMKSDILTAVTSKFDWDNDLNDLDLVGQHILRECFLRHFQRLTHKKPKVARFNTHAANDKPIMAAAPMVAATATTEQASTSR